MFYQNQIQLHKKIDIYDIYRNIKEKNNKKKESYDILLEKIYKKIQKASDNFAYFCYYDVPTFVVGYPIYNLNRCIAYLILQIRKSGFIAKFINPNTIYISWNPIEIKLEKKKFIQKNISLENIVQNKNSLPNKNINSYSIKQQQNILPNPNQFSENNNITSHKLASQTFKNYNHTIEQTNELDTFYNQTNHLQNKFDYSSIVPLQTFNKIPSPISTKKTLTYHPENLKYDPYKITAPTFNEIEKKNDITEKSHPFLNIKKKCNSNGKFILDLS